MQPPPILENVADCDLIFYVGEVQALDRRRAFLLLSQDRPHQQKRRGLRLGVLSR